MCNRDHDKICQTYRIDYTSLKNDLTSFGF